MIDFYLNNIFILVLQEILNTQSRLRDYVQLLTVRKDFPFFENLRHINDNEWQ